MNFLQLFASWLKARLHIKPTQLKGAPGVHDPAAAAQHVNSAVSGLVDTAAAQAPAVVENALHVHPDTLKGAPGISDHVAAAAVINGLVQSHLEQAKTDTAPPSG
ncbi:MAG TPA: hypothetical protein VNH18_15765 [Bryobacteraceae bacterium]|nr:hypothetical protein [Bryobacteraceae bacterium]